MNGFEEAGAPYRHAADIFLQGVLHVSELRLQPLQFLLQLQLFVLAVAVLGQFVVQLAFHAVQLQERRTHKKRSSFLHQSGGFPPFRMNNITTFIQHFLIEINNCFITCGAAFP